MRALLSSYGSRGDVEPMVALAVELQALGADVRMCAPPDEDFRQLLARAGVPVVPFGRPWRSWERPPTAEERQQRVTDFIAAQYDTVAEAAAGCDLVVATAMSQFVGSSVAEKLGIAYRCVLFCPDVLDGLDGRGFDELFGQPINSHRASVGLPPVDDVGEFMSPAGRWWLPTPSWPPGSGRRASMPGRPVPGSCPTSAPSRPAC
jgi:vancomycin aglycone glucosyltransferase